MSLDGENGVQKQDTLGLPIFEGAGGVFVVAEIGIDFFVDIDERGRDGLRRRDGEGEPLGGAGSMVGVLT